MDRGMIFSLGVLAGAVGIALLFKLLMLTDEPARRYFSDLLRRLGADRSSTPGAQGNHQPRHEARQCERLSQAPTVEQPRASCGSGARGIFALLLVAMLSGCAHGGARAVAPAVPVRVEALPACGFEAPYLPDPCRMEVAPGEWLAISNPQPRETKKHSWLWWLLLSLVTL